MRVLEEGGESTCKGHENGYRGRENDCRNHGNPVKVHVDSIRGPEKSDFEASECLIRP